ncbi:MAG: hypothetical protein ACOYJ6_17505, partial [Caulobacterales bacterium]
RFNAGLFFTALREAYRSAARVDLGWIREHTRLLARAQEWEAAGRNEVRLLAGDDVVSARAWLDRRPPNALAPTDLHRDFIAASAQAEAARYNADRLRAERLQKLVARTRRALFAAIGAALIAAAAGAIAYHQKLEADESRADAIDKQNQAITARETAEKAEKRALAAVMQAEVARLLQARLLQLAANRASPSAPFELDTLSQRYEGQSPDFIGVDLNGVAYYGTYRIKGGASMEEFLPFLRLNHENLYAPLESAGGAEAAKTRTPEFQSAWRRLARDPATSNAFAASQRAYVERHDYARLLRKLKSEFPSFDPARRTIVLRAVLFSAAIQHGANAPVVADALSTLGDLSRASDAQIIDEIYRVRADISKTFPEIQNETFIELLKRRNTWERDDALNMLEKL